MKKHTTKICTINKAKKTRGKKSMRKSPYHPKAIIQNVKSF
tara:strand:- start:284 stop:406 length:123 start_codon:yes stop_codon:yes gene_type:complete